MHRVSRRYAKHGIYVVGFDGGTDADGNGKWFPVYWTRNLDHALSICSFLNGGERPTFSLLHEDQAALEAETKAIDKEEIRKERLESSPLKYLKQPDDAA